MLKIIANNKINSNNNNNNNNNNNKRLPVKKSKVITGYRSIEKVITWNFAEHPLLMSSDWLEKPSKGNGSIDCIAIIPLG